jgi:hypothetical protein
MEARLPTATCTRTLALLETQGSSGNCHLDLVLRKRHFYLVRFDCLTVHRTNVANKQVWLLTSITVLGVIIFAAQCVLWKHIGYARGFRKFGRAQLPRKFRNERLSWKRVLTMSRAHSNTISQMNNIIFPHVRLNRQKLNLLRFTSKGSYVRFPPTSYVKTNLIVILLIK